MYSVCVDRDQSRHEQLEVLLFLIVCVNFQRVPAEVQHQMSCNLQSLIISDMGV